MDIDNSDIRDQTRHPIYSLQRILCVCAADPVRVQEKLAFRDRFGPGTEMPYLMREERGELTPEEIEEEDSDSDEEHIMDVDTMLANEALSRHLG